MLNNCLFSKYVCNDFCTEIYKISMSTHEHFSLLFHIFKIKFCFYKVHLKYIKRQITSISTAFSCPWWRHHSIYNWTFSFKISNQCAYLLLAMKKQCLHNCRKF